VEAVKEAAYALREQPPGEAWRTCPAPCGWHYSIHPQDARGSAQTRFRGRSRREGPQRHQEVEKRTHLRALADRMLGSLSETDDNVQDDALNGANP
jgi:hypothetical protein